MPEHQVSRSSHSVALGVLFCLSLGGPLRAAQTSTLSGPLPVHPTQESSGASPVSNGAFGYAIDQDGLCAAVGEPFNGPGGAVHVLTSTSSGWIEEAELRAHDARLFDYFGADVAIEGDTLVVGAYGAEPNFSGAAYVFERVGGTWVETAKLTPSNGGSSDFFGQTVAISGDRIAVGAPDHAGGAFLSGAVYVFVRQAGFWVQEAYLVGSPPDHGLRIGTSLDLDQVTLVAGGLCTVSGVPHAGCAFVWTRGPSGWVQQQELQAPQVTAGEDFGNGLALQGDLLAAGGVGAPGGKVYLLQRSAGQWNHVHELKRHARWTGAGFGRRLDLDGSRLLASGDSTAVVFRQLSGAWASEFVLVPGDWVGGYAWGGASLGAGRALFGLPGASLPTDPQCGLVFDFDLEALGVPLGRSFCGPAVQNSTGFPGVLAIAGSTAVTDDLLTLGASQVPALQVGLFLFGLGQTSVVPAGSAGPLCIAGSLVVRLPASLQDASGFGTMAYDLGTLDVPTIGAFHPGETWNFQAWYRDPIANVSNLTDAVEVTFH